MQYLNIVYSIAAFSLFNILLIIIISFWGRLLLRVLVGRRFRYGESLPLVVSLSLICAIALNLYNYKGPVQHFYYLFLFSSVLGVIAEFAYNFFKLKKTKAAITDILKKQHYLFAASLLSISIACLYATMWPSGKLETWWSYTNDLANWSLFADVIRGVGKESTSFNWPFLDMFLSDSQGSMVLAGFYATAKNLNCTLISIGWMLLSILVWIAMALYALIRKLFKLGFVSAILISFLSISSSLYIYSVFVVFLAQLLSTFAILALFNIPMVNYKNKGLLKNLRCNSIMIFFPLLLILLAYQSGLIVFFCLAILVRSSLIFFKFIDKHSFKQTIIKCAAVACAPVVASTFFACFIVPSTSIKVLERYAIFFDGLATGHEYNGWPFPLFNPLLFSGLPLTNKLNFPGSSNFFHYALFAGVLCLIAFLAASPQNKLFASFQRLSKNIKAMLFSFLTLIGCYILLFSIRGSMYEIWKFASYTILPLSFVPTSFMALALDNLPIKKSSAKLFQVLIILSMLAFSEHIFAGRAYVYDNTLAYPIIGPMPQLEDDIKRLHDYAQRYFQADKVNIIDLNRRARMNDIHSFLTDAILASIFSSDLDKISFLEPHIFYEPFGTPDYISYLSDGSKLLSSKKYIGPINGKYEIGAPMPLYNKLYIYDYDDIKKRGAISYKHFYPAKQNPHFYTPSTNAAQITVTLPQHLHGKDVIIKLKADASASDYDNFFTSEFVLSVNNSEWSRLTVKNYSRALILNKHDASIMKEEVIVLLAIAPEESSGGQVTLNIKKVRNDDLPSWDLNLGDIEILEKGKTNLPSQTLCPQDSKVCSFDSIRPLH